MPTSVYLGFLKALLKVSVEKRKKKPLHTRVYGFNIKMINMLNLCFLFNIVTKIMYCKELYNIYSTFCLIMTYRIRYIYVVCYQNPCLFFPCAYKSVIKL